MLNSGIIGSQPINWAGQKTGPPKF